MMYIPWVRANIMEENIFILLQYSLFLPWLDFPVLIRTSSDFFGYRTRHIRNRGLEEDEHPSKERLREDSTCSALSTLLLDQCPNVHLGLAESL